MASGSFDHTIRLWDVKQGLEGATLRGVLRGHGWSVYGVAWRPDGSVLASCGNDGTIRIWGLESGQALGTLRRDRPYERLNITGIQGLTEAQRASLRALGAFEDTSVGR